MTFYKDEYDNILKGHRDIVESVALSSDDDWLLLALTRPFRFGMTITIKTNFDNLII